ncbi:hypothetical protein CCR97_07935 [Rhodoplanes elegans]|uniref:Uncharacterized protein n=1 Tax=Rhodoplanes elegans TaxID=29408 RepID=A0A327KPV3_9BRAD|nr:hypothetical protein [Rhodoplanes elegans]MBK5958048.1 hypothetical protein [Rhodoplanes elegans]MBK5958140.1 hypothetical protein [Rhodoplanes elegans]RAI40427.1 hypothetical protein CH338_06185 [Rhodoplanes elegans]
MATEKQIEAAAEILRDMIDAPPSVTETLIRDALDAAERVAWEPIEHLPAAPCQVEYFYRDLKLDDCRGGPKSAVIKSWRDLRLGHGYWDGQRWRGLLTGHDVFQFQDDTTILPTHYRISSAPPAEEK